MPFTLELSDNVHPTAVATLALAVLMLAEVVIGRRTLRQTQSEIELPRREVEEAHRPVVVPFNEFLSRLPGTFASRSGTRGYRFAGWRRASAGAHRFLFVEPDRPCRSERAHAQRAEGKRPPRHGSGAIRTIGMSPKRSRSASRWLGKSDRPGDTPSARVAAKTSLRRDSASRLSADAEIGRDRHALAHRAGGHEARPVSRRLRRHRGTPARSLPMLTNDHRASRTTRPTVERRHQAPSVRHERCADRRFRRPSDWRQR